MSDVKVRVGADNTALESGLVSARNKVEQFRKNTQQNFTKMAGGLGGALSVGAIGGGIFDTINKGDQIGDLAERFKIGTTALQQFGYAGELSGTSMETVAKSLQKLRGASADAISNGGQLLQYFNDIGISQEQLQNMSTEELFLTVADAIANCSTESDKMTLATAMFGEKVASEMLPMLDKGKDGILELANTAPVFEESIINSFSGVADDLTTLKNHFSVLFSYIASGAVKIVEGFNKIGIILGSVFGGTFAIIKKQFSTLVEAFTKAVKGDFIGAFDVIKTMPENAINAASATVDSMFTKLDEYDQKKEESKKKYEKNTTRKPTVITTPKEKKDIEDIKKKEDDAAKAAAKKRVSEEDSKLRKIQEDLNSNKKGLSGVSIDNISKIGGGFANMNYGKISEEQDKKKAISLQEEQVELQKQTVQTLKEKLSSNSTTSGEIT